MSIIASAALLIRYRRTVAAGYPGHRNLHGGKDHGSDGPAACQSNVDFSARKRSQNWPRTSAVARRRERQIDGLKAAVVSLQKTIDDLSLPKEADRETAKKATRPPAKDAAPATAAEGWREVRTSRRAALTTRG